MATLYFMLVVQADWYTPEVTRSKKNNEKQKKPSIFTLSVFSNTTSTSYTRSRLFVKRDGLLPVYILNSLLYPAFTTRRRQPAAYLGFFRLWTLCNSPPFPPSRS